MKPTLYPLFNPVIHGVFESTAKQFIPKTGIPTVKAPKPIKPVSMVNPNSLSLSDNEKDVKIKTMNDDIKVLLEEHNKIVQDYVDQITQLNNIIKDLNDSKEAEKKSLRDEVSQIKNEVKEVIRSRPTTPNTSRPSTPLNQIRIKK